MPNIAATNSHTITGLVQAGETLYGTIAGKGLTDNGQKISDGITSFLDGLFPQAQAKLSFDINGVFAGATKALQGVDESIVAVKTKAPVVTPAVASEAATSDRANDAPADEAVGVPAAS